MWTCSHFGREESQQAEKSFLKLRDTISSGPAPSLWNSHVLNQHTHSFILEKKCVLATVWALNVLYRPVGSSLASLSDAAGECGAFQGPIGGL